MKNNDFSQNNVFSIAAPSLAEIPLAEQDRPAFSFNQMLAERELAVLRNAAMASGAFGAHRPVLFRGFALKAKQLFAAYPAMPFLRLRVTLRLVDRLQGADDRHIRYEHDVQVEAPECPELAGEDARAQFFFDHVPFWVIGDGEVRLDRQTPALVRLLAAPVDSEQEAVEAYTAGMALASAFQTLTREFYLDGIR